MTRDNYHSGIHSNPSTSQRIVYFHPPLQRAVASGQTINYDKPLFRVIQKNDIQSYSLGTNNLFSFSLDLEEAQA